MDQRFFLLLSNLHKQYVDKPEARKKCGLGIDIYIYRVVKVLSPLPAPGEGDKAEATEEYDDTGHLLGPNQEHEDCSDGPQEVPRRPGQA